MSETGGSELSTDQPDKIRIPRGSMPVAEFIIPIDDPGMDPGIARMLQSYEDVLKERKATDIEHAYTVFKAPDGGYYGQLHTQRKGGNPMAQSVIFNPLGFSITEQQVELLREKFGKKEPQIPKLPSGK